MDTETGGGLMLTFRVYGVAMPKGNMRAFLKRGMKFPIVTESNRSVKSWQQLVAEGASRALQDAPQDLIAFGVRVTVCFYLPRPKKHHKVGVFVAHCTAPDLDKLSRAVLDALSKVAYYDDAQVTELVAGKYYTTTNGAAYVDVRVEPAPSPKTGLPIPVLPLPLPLFEGQA
jgi:Holliday junction resolvase RusA-like endonuclease